MRSSFLANTSTPSPSTQMYSRNGSTPAKIPTITKKKRLNALNHCPISIARAKIAVFLVKLYLFLKNNLYTCGVISKALTQGILSSSNYQITFYFNFLD